MHLPTSALLALAAAGRLAAADGLLGFALGVKQAGGACKVQADYEADFDAIREASGSTIVRIYSAADCDVVAQILPAAEQKEFRVILGVWPEDAAAYEVAKAAIVSTAVNFKDQVHAITVGSESLYRKTYTAEQLAAKIGELRTAAPDFRYGTADSWNRYADGTADPLIPSADILLVNAFAYWQGAAIDSAVSVFNDDINQAFTRIKATAAKAAEAAGGGGREVELWVGETGWPSEGTTYQAAVPGLASAERFFREGVCGSLATGTGAGTFYFEAFDEPWKPDSVGQDGSSADEKHWGAMTADRKAKFSLKCSS